MRIALLVAVLAAVWIAGCPNREPEGPADGTYTARGQVLSMPAQAGGEMTVHHEAVTGFVNRQGRREPMESMSMPFGVAPEVSLDGVAPGDKVEITFELRWRGNPPLRIVKLRELPPETVLHLGGPTLEPVAPLGPGAPAITPEPQPATTPPLASGGPPATADDRDGGRTGRVSAAI